jgi:CO/xanthine dehydrogenase FAD-binding subunit
MDLHTVSSYRRARHRGDLALAPGETLLAGGTWLFSEPQPDVTGLVDLTTLGWPPLEDLPDGGLRIAATCTIAELVATPQRPLWQAQPLFRQCATALLASPKVWREATVGGNICRAYAAAGMVALAVTLDATAVLWTADGDCRLAVSDLVTGNGTTAMQPGDVLRAIDIPATALGARTAYRKIALAELGRSAAVLTGRVDADGHTVLAITAATVRPSVLRYRTMPDAATLHADVETLDGWYTDALGTADWRRAVSGLLLDEVRQELAS